MEDFKTKPKKHEDILMAAIGFTEEDLDANVEGVLSSTQTARFRKDCTLWFGTLLFVGAVILNSWLGRTLDVLALLLIVFAVFAALRTVQLFIVIRSKEVACIEGWIKLNIDSNRGGLRYSVSTENKTFQVNKVVFLAFKNGDPYRIYFAPFINKILSVEWLRA